MKQRIVPDRQQVMSLLLTRIYELSNKRRGLAMKHVIVIETTDIPPTHIGDQLQKILLRVCEMGCEDEGISAVAYGRFNVTSAIGALHEMYGAPEWKGGL